MAWDLEVGCCTLSLIRSVNLVIVRLGKRYLAINSMSVKLSIGFPLSRKTLSLRKALSFSNNNKNAAMFVYLFLSYDKYFTLTKNILDLREGRGCRKVTMDFTLKNLVRIFVKPDKIVRFLLR